MYIKRIILKGFKNLALSNIEELDYSIEMPLQLVLGKNGSGKSSLLRELSPFPANTSNFDKGGFKEVHLEYNGNTYLLKSEISRSGRHWFIKNESERLNDGGTAAVQKELVEREFNITPFIYKLITGQLRFTDMSPSARKDALTTISNLKLDYALGLFERLRQAHRDTQGAIKHVDSKLEGVNSQLLAIGDLNALQEEHLIITESIRELIPLSVNQKINTAYLEQQLNNALDNLDSYIVAQGHCLNINDSKYRSTIDVEKAILEIDNKLYAEKTNIDELLNNLSELTKLTAVLEDNEDGITILEDRVKYIDSELAKLPPAISTVDYVVSTDIVLNKLTGVYGRLQDLYANKDIEMVSCTRLEYQESKSKLEEANTALVYNKAYLGRQENIRSKVELARLEDKTCPKCETVILGSESMSDEEYSALLAKIEELRVTVSESEAKRNKIAELHDRYELYVRYFKSVHSTIYSENELLPLWNSMGEIKWIIDNLNVSLDLIRKEINSLKIKIHRDSLLLDKSNMVSTIDNFRLAESTNACARKKSIESALDKRYASLSTYREKKKHLEQELSRFRACTVFQETYLKLKDELTLAWYNWCNGMAHSLIGDKIEEFQNRSGDIRAILSKKNHLLISAYELKEDHTRLAEELEAYKELSRELSPTTGVIAEIMREYLDNFLGEINKIIGFVWEYPLSVKSCGVETVGLDYKFPLVVSDLDTPIDISEGSQGQKDIINFAFTIVAMAYMGLQDYPIYMDEVGASFDHKHRGNLINYIKTLIESRQCSQLFMVNHYSSDHGGLSHTNTLVLSADNIVLPSNYNEHVKITYK